MTSSFMVSRLVMWNVSVGDVKVLVLRRGEGFFLHCRYSGILSLKYRKQMHVCRFSRSKC